MPQSRSYFSVCTECFQIGRIVCADGTRGPLIGTRTAAREQLALYVGQKRVSSEDAETIMEVISGTELMHESFPLHDQLLEDIQMEDPLYTTSLKADHRLS
jgi:hypothetical protein